MVLNTGIPVLRKIMLKNLQKIPIGEGQVQVGAEMWKNWEQTDGQSNDFNRALFF
jgi:hypothetical protein